jgi:HK97 family phage prohead protease
MHTYTFGTKDFRSRRRSDEEFVFEGYGAIFGTPDRQGDVIEPGAVTETIKANGGRFPLLSNHDFSLRSRLGVASVRTDSTGIRVKGYVNTETQIGRETASDIRHAEAHEAPLGLSFGYRVHRDRFDDAANVRRLKDLSIYEFSVTQIPTHSDAQITDTKRYRPPGSVADVLEEVERLTQELKASPEGSNRTWT